MSKDLQLEPRSVAFRKQREQSWIELEQMIELAKKKGLAALDLHLLPIRYREAMSSLSVARATALDRALIQYLEALCARAYLLIYGSRRPSRRVFHLMFVAIPQHIRSIFREFWLALGFFLLGVIVAWTLTQANPIWFSSFVPAQMSQGRDPWASTSQLKKTLYSEPQKSGNLTVFASFLFTNNARVGILCFALGIAFGLPTALLLFYNGLILGAFLALFNSRDLLWPALGWLLPHGIPEIAAVILCGAAGLTIARAMLFPADKSRRDSLKQAGQRAAIVVVGAILLFALAALFEGYFRQSVLDDTIRLSVAAINLLWLSSWILFTGRNTETHT
jgi:uncharacterized membrane protein SpoIIM required for sporulation